MKPFVLATVAWLVFNFIFSFAGKWVLSPCNCVFSFGVCFLAFAVCFKSLFLMWLSIDIYDYSAIEKALPIFSNLF